MENKGWNEFLVSLNNVLKAFPLPGQEAQYRLAPVGRVKPKPNLKPNGAREAGVAIVNFPLKGKPHFILIRRTAGEGVHSSQLSLPGGRLEAGEEPADAALRECEEETGVMVPPSSIVGMLTPLYVPPSNYFVHPVIAACDSVSDFRPNPDEVEEVLVVSVADLLNTQVSFTDLTVRGSNLSQVPCFMLNGEIIWGATAMILSEYRHLLSAASDEPDHHPE